MSRPDGELGRGRHDVSPDMIGNTSGRREFLLGGEVSGGEFIALVGAGVFTVVAGIALLKSVRKRPTR